MAAGVQGADGPDPAGKRVRPKSLTDAWHERLSAVGWFFQHLDDVLSDMSVFHRVDELDQLPVSVFLPRMVRLPVYDGAVRHALRLEAEGTAGSSEFVPGQAGYQDEAPSVIAHSRDQLAALNQTREYGPRGVNEAGVFDLG
ncbi:hypothetical protein ACFORO_25910 [Amycolatopsis halotolerans]|uniref:Uncharacterized protein n=1 Tax=Amycolatopsis halotolerans TaxID=330083 RepID=A0ABV7QJY9_9PSEU